MNSDDDAGGKFLGRVMGGIGLIAAYLILRGDQHAAPPRIRPPGLPNLGNTCYMNSILQVAPVNWLCLAHLTHLFSVCVEYTSPRSLLHITVL